ncbi:putative nuclease HARBI1 [Tanacetum coccineum]|uniref:Nuclease HARBI1 n=1 Tax=Tanacetum coccineum TaxID=301880 RepID=A0ABQ5HQ88_9ASTR
MDQDTSSEIPNVNLENAKIPNVNLENVEIPNVNLENVEIPNVNLKNVAINIDDDQKPIPKLNFYSTSSYGLKSSDKMTAVEKLGIFFYTLALGVSNRDVSERFQRSGETISRAFHEVLEAITGRSKGFHGLAREMIKPRDPTFQSTPHQIINDKRYMSIVLVVLMVHILGHASQRPNKYLYIGRKGIPTFNVMAVCDFDLCFTFISVGWEGSTHDTRVFLHAINNRSMNFPKPSEGKYYLVDKGYPDRKGYLVPYPKTRYHKSQFENEPPKNMKEAFNRSHSSLRSFIEKSFGILKKRWKILGGMPKYSVETQHDIIIDVFALHNYIRNNDKEDKVFTTFEQHSDYMGCDELRDVRGTVTNNDNISSGTSNEMKQIRNDIATSIWNVRRR